MIIDFIINVYGNTFIEILVTKHCLGLFKCILCLGIMAELSCIVLVHLIITVGHTFWGKSDTKMHFHEQKDMLPFIYPAQRRTSPMDIILAKVLLIRVSRDNIRRSIISMTPLCSSAVCSNPSHLG